MATKTKIERQGQRRNKAEKARAPLGGLTRTSIAEWKHRDAIVKAMVKKWESGATAEERAKRGKKRGTTVVELSDTTLAGLEDVKAHENQSLDDAIQELLDFWEQNRI